MKFQIGDKVRVVKQTDETLDAEWLGKVGTVKAFNTNGATGNTERDPLIAIYFDDGTSYDLWTEELELLERKSSDPLKNANLHTLS